MTQPLTDLGDRQRGIENIPWPQLRRCHMAWWPPSHWRLELLQRLNANRLSPLGGFSRLVAPTPGIPAHDCYSRLTFWPDEWRWGTTYPERIYTLLVPVPGARLGPKFRGYLVCSGATWTDRGDYVLYLPRNFRFALPPGWRY
ncbi:hypothetical protein JNJ66_05830 [Candidatus Saccharibacteria bacterium]|nr:hypothetical protein [Candidatus Saccharibacteria bacterium]